MTQKRYYEYGKVKFINGLSVSSSMKVVMRLISERNEGALIFENSSNSMAPITQSPKTF